MSDSKPAKHRQLTPKMFVRMELYLIPHGRIQELSLFPLASVAQRVELAVLIYLQTHGRITADRVWDLLCLFRQVRSIDFRRTDPFNEDVLHDFDTIWHNLELQARGETIEEGALFPSDFSNDAGRRWMRARHEAADTWWRESLALLTYQLQNFMLSDAAVAESLPDRVRDEVIRSSQHE